jgi:hypothetical protein
MTIDDLYNDFLANYDGRDLKGSTTSVMGSMGAIMASDKDNFIELMKESGIDADYENLSDAALIDLYVEGLMDPESKPLKVGSALLIGYHNQTAGFDGDIQIDSAGVKAVYHTLCTYFRSPSENYSNAAGLGYAIGEAAKLGSNLSQAQQKKKYGALDIATKKAEAKTDMAKQLLAARQAEIEAKKAKSESSAKVTKTILIVSGSVLAIGLIGLLIYKLKTK